MTEAPNGKGTSDLLVLTLLVLGLGALIIIAGLWGTETNLIRIIQYFSSAVPIIIGFAFMQRKQESNDAKTEETRQNVGYLSGSLNGQLDKRFNDLESRIVAKVEESKTTAVVDPSAGNIVLTSGAVDNVQ